MSENTTHYILITGGGAGFGKSLAMAFAARGHNIALASLFQPELDETQKTITQKYPTTSVKTFAVDMVQPDAHQQIAKWIDAEKIQLGGLINNVGMGYSGEFEKFDLGFLNKLLHLNVVFTHNLTHILSGKLMEAKPSFILNVASMAAFFPIPYKTVYAASKGFVLTFSKALRQEYKAKGVQVNCICPGPMTTNLEVNERIKNIGWRRHFINITSPEKMAEIAVRGVENNTGVIVPRLNDKLNLALKAIIPAPILPRLLRRLSKNSF